VTGDRARRLADVILGAAALGVVYYVVKTPPLRRFAWRLAVTGGTVTVPAWFRRELQRAWAESGERAI
jgi:hypothetical protein